MSKLGGWMMGLKLKQMYFIVLKAYLAEEVGFEPTNGCPLPVFKTGAFNRSATLPLTLGLPP